MGKQYTKTDILYHISWISKFITHEILMKKYEKYPIHIYNSLSRQKELFTPLHTPNVGMYVCGPTVYNDVHLGNCRTFVSFDVIYRYLLHLGYKVRYVRNITDVGHLTESGEDKMATRARIEKIEPMEVAQKYTRRFHEIMSLMNTLPPSIEPSASGHIPEQIEMVQDILDNGLAYVANGSVYFDTQKYVENSGNYGELSGRIIEELFSETRVLKNQDEKRNPADFAIWMKADENHIMRWESPWSVGFPGWHLECSAMSTKYLGTTFDIHGGGADLKFPHHENEIAQNVGACNVEPANYWIHTNMLLMNGKKMSKSDGNTITPIQLMEGDSEHVSQGYDPMTIRFFFLQAHYSSTLDLSDAALQAASRGFRKLTAALKIARSIDPAGYTHSGDQELADKIKEYRDQCYREMSDDFNTAKTLAVLFEMAGILHELDNGQIKANNISAESIELLANTFISFMEDVLGLQQPEDSNGKIDDVMEILLDIRQKARAEKNWALSDQIRDQLAAVGIEIKDGKEGTSYTL